MSRALRRHNDEDAGLGLIEILVASLIGLLLMTAVGAAFIQTTKVTTLAVQTRGSIGSASNAMQELTEVVHLATPITVQNATAQTPAVVYASATKLQVYALVDTTDPVNPAPSLVTLDTTSGSLVDTRCVATPVNGYWTFSTCASTTTRTVAGTFVTPGTGQNALFTYRAPDGTILPLTGSNSSLPATSLASVSSIIISVNLRAPGAKTPPVYLQSVVGMPNVGTQQETS